jgi:hypothetical protein
VPYIGRRPVALRLCWCMKPKSMKRALARKA